MKKIALSIILASAIISIHARQNRSYQLPREERIRDCICKHFGGDYFDEKTDFSKENANKSMPTATLIQFALTNSLYDFGAYLKRDYEPKMIGIMLYMTQMGTADLYKCMLGERDGQAAIDELKENGINVEDAAYHAQTARDLTDLVINA